MIKKINMVIVSFFLILSAKGGLLFSIYLPVMLFYIFKDEKNMYYIYPVSLISIFLFQSDMLIPYLALIVVTTIFLFIFKLGVKNEIALFYTPKVIISFYILIINIVSMFIFPSIDGIWYFKIILTIISMCIYLYLDVYLLKLLKDFKKIKEYIFSSDDSYYQSYVYLELLIGVLTTFSASFVSIANFNLSIIVGTYFAMYLSRKFKNIYSLLFSLTVVILEYVILKIEDSLIIMLVSGVYSVESIYTIGIFNIFLTILIVFNITSSPTLYLLLMLLSIVFEVISYCLIKTKKNNNEEYIDIHESAQKTVNEEILKFAGFLDRFVVGFQNPKGFNDKLSTGIKTIVDRHCMSCSIKNECFNKNKSSLYFIFKDILVLNNDAKYNHELFSEYCYKYSSIINTSKLLNQKIDYQNPNKDEKDANNYILLAQISGVSNALKNYVVDTTSKEELNYQSLYKAKEYLIDLEYYVTYYEIVRTYVDDFLVKIGIKNIQFEEVKYVLETLFETLTSSAVSIIKTSTDNSTIYINIVPKLTIDITYAYGSLPSNTEVLSGDNYLIKEQDNGHILFAISDGMGKGYSAFYESDMTLHLVEDIVQLNVETSTALEVLNTFYTVQDYLERYATLDFLDINRHTGIATFYKMGANTTYVFKENGLIEKIINKSLPLGIDEEVEKIEYRLENGDMIVMSSDGVLENLIDDEKLEKFIKDIKTLAPQQIVYEILSYTSNNDIKTNDDMTLIVLKIQKSY